MLRRRSNGRGCHGGCGRKPPTVIPFFDYGKRIKKYKYPEKAYNPFKKGMIETVKGAFEGLDR